MILINSNIFRDNIPTVRLAYWPLSSDLYDGDVAAGPVPVLFAPNPEEATASLNEDLARSHKDVMKLNKLFGVFEFVNLEAAIAIMKKPRYKELVTPPPLPLTVGAKYGYIE